MKLTETIAYRLDRLPKGYVFSYRDLSQEVDRQEALIKALNRMAASGRIAKLSKGKFYKPEQSPFGELPPPPQQIVKDLLVKRGKVVGYLTGFSVYPQFGLSTQVSNTIQIGKNEIRPTFKRGRYTISFIKQKNSITKGNVPLLQLLDSLRYVKKIPGTSVSDACQRLLALIKDCSPEELVILIRLALKYPPYTRALLGAMLEQIDSATLKLEGLKRSLNPITRYKIPGASLILSDAENWKIV